MNTDPITAFAAAFQRIQEQVQRIEELEARLARLEQASTRPPQGRKDSRQDQAAQFRVGI